MYIAIVDSTEEEIVITNDLNKAKNEALAYHTESDLATSVYKYDKKTKKRFGEQIEGYELEEELEEEEQKRCFEE